MSVEKVLSDLVQLSYQIREVEDEIQRREYAKSFVYRLRNESGDYTPSMVFANVSKEDLFQLKDWLNTIKTHAEHLLDRNVDYDVIVKFLDLSGQYHGLMNFTPNEHMMPPNRIVYNRLSAVLQEAGLDMQEILITKTPDCGPEPTNMQKRARVMAGWLIGIGLVGLMVLSYYL